jgi:suppressor for copper-sensitivity B
MAIVILYCIVFIVCTLLLKKERKISAILLALTIFIIPNDKGISYIDNNNQLLWKKYEDINDISSIIDEHIKKKKIVILNISADWCLTCKYNKITALNNEQIIQIMRSKNITCIEGDMTKKNDQLMRFISAYNRVGIPFTIIYGPGAKEGILLSEMPTVDEILNVIQKAEKSK